MGKVNVSVIMSEYNTNPSFLRKSIYSVLNQTYKDFELILIDDCSTNDVSKLVQEFNDSRIKLIKNEKNLGLVDSLNIAIKASSGKYLIRMDTDDICINNRFEILVNYISKNKKYSVVGSRAYEFNDDDGIIGIIGKAGEIGKKELMRGGSPIHPSVIMKKCDIEAIGLYKKYKRCEDFVLWSELLLDRKRIFVLEDVLLKYRVNDGDYAKRKFNTRKDEITAKKKYFKLMGANAIDYLFILRSIISSLCPVVVIKFIRKIVEVKKK